MAMFPHERSLVEKLKDKPFALLGVNADNTLDDLKKCVSKEKINWRSWYDGGDGPISKQYRIKGFPTIFVLDHKGVIRFKDVREDDMDKAVEKLLGEIAESKSTAAK